MWRLLPLVVLLTPGACATLSEGECRYADWREIGSRDGANGEPWDLLVKHQQACAEHGVGVDTTAYRAGHSEGLERYCTVQNGFDAGSTGKRYARVCTAESEPAFLDGYRLGRGIYQLRPELRRYEHQIRDLEKRLTRDGYNESERRDFVAALRVARVSREAAARELGRLEGVADQRGLSTALARRY